MKSPFDIVKTARITEKGTRLTEKQNQYTFEVDRRATKQDIRSAVQTIFKKTVLTVRTMNIHGKLKQSRLGVGRKRHWKKAIVTLKAGEKLDLI